MAYRFARLGSQALAVALFVAAGSSLWAQSCVDDNPPNGGPAPCTSKPVCPTTAGSEGQRFAGGELVHYYKKDDLGSCNRGNTCDSPYASCRAGRCTIDMLGELYRPPDPEHPERPNSEPAPAVVLVPGSTACSSAFPAQCVYRPEQFCQAKSRFLDLGYVVLEALPPGYGLDTTHNSTGLYVSNYVTQQVNESAPCAVNHPGEPGAACAAYDLRDEGLAVISKSIAYLDNRTFVSKDGDGHPRVAIIGHSLGGIRTLGLNRKDFGQAAVVDLSAASESWCTSGLEDVPLQSDLQDDVTMATRPIYFIQPRNDQNTGPTALLTSVEGTLKRAYEAAIFPNVLDASGDPFTFGDWAHICFVTDKTDVDRWMPSVVDFIQRYGVK